GRAEGSIGLRGSTDGLCFLGAENPWIGKLRALDDVGVDDGRQIVDEQVLAAFAIDLSKAETVTSTNDRFRIDLEGKAEARSKVELRHIDQGTVVERAGRSLDKGLSIRIVVG